MAKRKEKIVEPEARVIMAMNYYSNVVIGIERGFESIHYIRVEANGLMAESASRETFLQEFYRDLLQEEWVALIKFWAIAMRKPENDERALALLERIFQMKLKELAGKDMSELVGMYNELAKAQGKAEVAKFKTLEAAKIAVVKLTNGKPAPSKKAAAATGKGAPGRPRTGIGAFAKGLLAKGKSNAETLAEVKKEFPKNSTTLSCIAYYRAHMVKAGTLEKKAKAPKKESKATGKSKAKSKDNGKTGGKKQAKGKKNNAPSTPAALAAAA